MTRKTIVIVSLLYAVSLFLFVDTRSDSDQDADLGSYMIANTMPIRVPDDHAKIQWAINNATDGDTIKVRAGTYFENVIVNRTVSLFGENRETTIIDGNGKQTLFYVTADNVVISGFTLQHGHSGIWLWSSKNSKILESNVKNNAYGIRLDHSSNTSIIGNNIEDNEWFGITLDRSGNCVLRDNKLLGKKYNFRVDGDTLSDYANDIDTSNTVNGKPMYYLLNQRNLTIDSTFPEIGYLAIVNSTNITTENLALAYNGQGILFAYTKNSTARNLTTTGNWNGIKIVSSSDITVKQNNANNNFDYGIKLVNTRKSLIVENEANNNNWAGLGVFTSQNCTLTENIADNNYYGFHIVYSSNLRVHRNEANSRVGGYSIVLYYSNYNVIYHNNFINNFIYAPVKSTNSWDNGLEGNYWRSHSFNDMDQDGIGDTPYVLQEGNQDNYPLMGRFFVFNVTSEHFITVISNSTIHDFQFDQASETIRFNAAGQNGTLGFCRIRAPGSLINGTFKIIITGYEPLTLKELSLSNDDYKYLYVTYIHSTFEESATSNVLTTTIVLLLSMSAAFVFIVALLKSRTKVDVEPEEVENASRSKE